MQQPSWPPPQQPSTQPPPYPQPGPFYPPQVQQPYRQPAPYGYPPPYPPQQQYYQPPMFVQQPPPPKKRPNGCLIAIVVLVVLALFGAIGSVISSQGRATPSPGTPQAQPSSVRSQASSQYTTAPILGSDISVFLATYGQPDMIDGGISYAYYTRGIVVSIDASSASKHVNSVLVSPASGTTWDASQAKAACLPYMPSDARFKYILTIYGKKHIALYHEFVYFSPSLVKQLPASDFIDQNFKRDKPGTFVIALSYVLGSTVAFDSCFVDASMQ